MSIVVRTFRFQGQGERVTDTLQVFVHPIEAVTIRKAEEYIPVVPSDSSATLSLWLTTPVCLRFGENSGVVISCVSLEMPELCFSSLA